jgi:hypothetical protein
MTTARIVLAAAGLAALSALGPAAGAAAAAASAARPAAVRMLPAAQRGAAAVSTVYSVEEAGYQASGSGHRFRYVRATLRLPDSARSPYTRGEGVSVQLRSANETVVLVIAATPGARVWNAGVKVERRQGQGGCMKKDGCFTHVNTHSPPFGTGNAVSFNLYYDRHSGTLYYTATDSTLGQAFVGWFPDPAEQFTSARVGVEFGPNAWTPGSRYAPPSAARQLASFTGVRFTAYNGSQGAIGGAKWTTSRVLATSTGTARGTRIATPSLPRASGATTFTVTAARKKK